MEKNPPKSQKNTVDISCINFGPSMDRRGTISGNTSTKNSQYIIKIKKRMERIQFISHFCMIIENSRKQPLTRLK